MVILLLFLIGNLGERTKMGACSPRWLLSEQEKIGGWIGAHQPDRCLLSARPRARSSIRPSMTLPQPYVPGSGLFSLVGHGAIQWFEIIRRRRNL